MYWLHTTPTSCLKTNTTFPLSLLWESSLPTSKYSLQLDYIGYVLSFQPPIAHEKLQNGTQNYLS